MLTASVHVRGDTSEPALEDDRDSSADPFDDFFINGKQTRESSPFGCHVGNGEALLYGEVFDAIADELNRVVQNFVLIELPAERHDDIFAGHTGR